MKKKGFTMVEILMIVAIISILATIILVSLAISTKKKTAVTSYKTTMNSLKTAYELCTVGGGELVPGDQGDPICDPDIGSNYPMLPPKCGSQPSFYAWPTTGTNWEVTTVDSLSTLPLDPWDCFGCRLRCQVTGCIYEENENGDCF